MSEHELRMEIRHLRARLAAAENVCALFSWTASRSMSDDDREVALHELWREWREFPGVSSDPDDWPHLTDAALAFRVTEARRRRERLATERTEP